MEVSDCSLWVHMTRAPGRFTTWEEKGGDLGCHQGLKGTSVTKTENRKPPALLGKLVNKQECPDSPKGRTPWFLSSRQCGPLNLNLVSDTIHIQMRAKESGGGAADKSELLRGIQMGIQSSKRSLFTKALLRASASS